MQKLRSAQHHVFTVISPCFCTVLHLLSGREHPRFVSVFWPSVGRLKRNIRRKTKVIAVAFPHTIFLLHLPSFSVCLSSVHSIMFKTRSSNLCPYLTTNATSFLTLKYKCYGHTATSFCVQAKATYQGFCPFYNFANYLR